MAESIHDHAGRRIGIDPGCSGAVVLLDAKGKGQALADAALIALFGVEGARS